MRYLKIKTLLTFLLVVGGIGFLSAETPDSLSDFVIEGFEPTKDTTGARNPFMPTPAEETMDASLLSFDGVVVGAGKKVALISGKIVEEGHSVGNFIVKEISPGSATLQSPEGETRLTMSSYVVGSRQEGSLYEIVFQGADLRDALQLIATAGGFNIIVPDNQAGRVSLIFHQTALREAMGSILRVNGLEFAEEGDIVRVGPLETFAAGAYYVTENFRLRYATAKDLVSSIKDHLSEKGTVTADNRTNTLIVRDSQATIDTLRPLVGKLDRQDTQVRIEAKIVDVTRTFSRSLGIQWGFLKDTGQVQGFGASAAGNISGTSTAANVSLPATNPTSGLGMIVGNLFNGTDLNAQITAAEEKGDVHIISQPSISTVNNTPAKIRSGLKIYVKNTSSTIAVGGTASSSDNDLEEIDTGIQLTVTPQITSDNTIKLKIDAVESEADFTRTVDGIPSVIDNTASTTVLVGDGQTTVIGGMMKIKKTNSKSGVPFVNNIPILGWFFSSKSREKTDNELLVFITPHIIRDGPARPKTDKTALSPVINEPEPKKVVTRRRNFHQNKYDR